MILKSINSFLDKLAGDNNEDTIDNSSIDEIIESGKAKVVEALKNEEAEKEIIDNVITFVGAAGGTGTSTLVANVAQCILNKKKTVCVIDMNILNPIQYLYFGVDLTDSKVNGSKDLVDIIVNREPIGEGLYRNKNLGLLFSKERNVYDKIDMEDEDAVKNIKEILNVIRKLYDIVIIDCPYDLQHEGINQILYYTDHIYMVWDENIECIANLERMRKNMAMFGINAYAKTSVIFNKRTDMFYSKAPFRELNVKVESVIPYDRKVAECALDGKMFINKASSSSETTNIVANEIERLAETIMINGGSIDSISGRIDERKEMVEDLASKRAEIESKKLSKKEEKERKKAEKLRLKEEKKKKGFKKLEDTDEDSTSEEGNNDTDSEEASEEKKVYEEELNNNDHLDTESSEESESDLVDDDSFEE